MEQADGTASHQKPAGAAFGAAALVGVALCCPSAPLLRALRPIPFGVGVLCDFFFSCCDICYAPVMSGMPCIYSVPFMTCHEQPGTLNLKYCNDPISHRPGFEHHGSETNDWIVALSCCAKEEQVACMGRTTMTCQCATHKSTAAIRLKKKQCSALFTKVVYRFRTHHSVTQDTEFKGLAVRVRPVCSQCRYSLLQTKQRTHTPNVSAQYYYGTNHQWPTLNCT